MTTWATRPTSAVLDEKTFRQNVRAFFANLASRLRENGLKATIRSDRVRWTGGECYVGNRSGERCMPYRIDLMDHRFGRPWGERARELEIGAADAAELMATIPGLVGFILGELTRSNLWDVYHPHYRA
jgi:hypothetical protein